MKRRTLTLLALTPLALLATGCVSTAPDANTNIVAAPEPLTSLTSTDALGSILFVESVALGPTTGPGRPTFAEVPSR